MVEVSTAMAALAALAAVAVLSLVSCCIGSFEALNC